MKEGFYVNGAHTYGTHRLRCLARSVTEPQKDDYTERVPFSNVVYDFGNIFGRQTYGERQLSYTFEFLHKHRKKAQDRIMNIKQWLHWRGYTELYDDLLPDYHYEVREPSVSFSESHGVYTLSFVFPAAPEILPNSNKTDEIDPADVILPDIDGDGYVNSVDVSMILSAYSAISTGKDPGLTPEQLRACDADRDGRITSADASLVMSFYSALSTGRYECTREGWARFLNDMKTTEGVI